MKGLSALWTKLILRSYGWKPTDKVVRYENNPVLSAKDIPYDAALIFNAGVVKYKGKYLMAFRDDYGLFSLGADESPAPFAIQGDSGSTQQERIG